jgi:hypothetical protein
VLTNYHVIAVSITHEDEYDHEQMKKVTKEYRENVTVKINEYKDLNVFVGTNHKVATIVAVDKKIDLALLKLEDEHHTFDAARLPKMENYRLDRGEKVYAAGAGLGKPPFLTEGLVGHMQEMIDGHPYILASAPIIFGNSGGALYRKTGNGELDPQSGALYTFNYRYEMIGVPSRLSATGGFFSSSAVTHMGWHIPVQTIIGFLKRNKLENIIAE